MVLEPTIVTKATEEAAEIRSESMASEEHAVDDIGSESFMDTTASEELHEVYIIPRNLTYRERRLSITDFLPYFHLLAHKAAEKMKISYSNLKLACEFLGIKNWPGKSVNLLSPLVFLINWMRFLESAIEVLDYAVGNEDQQDVMRKMK